jgi:TRAP transporter 4TM/12TM fusion protein
MADNTRTASGPDENGAPDIAAVADTGARSPGGGTGRFLYGVAVAWSLFQLWYASPLPFYFNIFIFNATQARAIHLAFAIFLAFTAFPGIIRRTSALTVFGVAYVVTGAMLLVYAASLQIAGDQQWLIFAVMGALALMAAWSASRPAPLDRVPVADWLMAVIGAASSAYLYVFYQELATRPGAPTLTDLVVAGAGLVMLLEATRRSLGPPLMFIAILFLVYTFAGPYMPDVIAHRGASFQRAMSQQWLSAEGVFGIALGVSTSFVFLFVLFGAMLERAGAGNYFIQVAFALLGHLRGGPAKAAVVASGMTGLISGSSIANTVTTGTFTIPLMKRVGFSAEKAGAVEVSSSVNGQIMPPVMGAAAFLMVEYVGIPYVEVIRHALLPAVISYIALFYIVHLEALKADMEGLPRRNPSTFLGSVASFGMTLAGLIILAGIVYYGIGWTRDLFGETANYIVAAGVLAAYFGLLWVSSRVPTLELDDPDSPLLELPEAQPTILSGLHFLLPVVVLVWALIVERLSPGLSAFYAVAFMIFILLTQRPITAAMRGTALGPSVVQGVIEFFDGLAAGARNMVGIGVATAAAGIIVGTVAQTGLGGVMIELVEFLSGGNLIVMLVLTAVISLILGLGLPTTANYIIVATLMAPIVVELGSQQGLIVPLIAVHLFVFYFGLMADVTPPVGLASFAAAAISRGDPLKTGVQAFYYSLRTVALPFIFVFNTQLLLIGVGGWVHLVVVVVSATVAMLVFAAATQNYFLVRSRWYETIALLLVAFTLFRPGYWMDMIDAPFDPRPPNELREIIEETPANGFVRLQVEGMDAMGRDVSKVVMVRLGEPAPAEQRLREVGMGVMFLGDQVQITDVTFGSQAARYGIDFGMNITEVLVPDADRAPKEIMFIPALVLLGLVVLLQWRRRRAHTPANPSKENADVSRDPAAG